MVTETRPALDCELRGCGDARRADGRSRGRSPAMLAYLTERWDGQGPLRRARGEGIPLPMRIVHVAIDAAFQRHLGGAAYAARTRRRARRPRLRSRGGGLPRRRQPPRSSRFDDAASAWDEVLAVEPAPPLVLDGDERSIAALAAMGRFADLISPYLVRALGGRRRAGSRGCGALPDRRQRACAAMRRAGLVHDLGRVAVARTHLAEAGSADRRRVGAGAAAPLPHRARALSRSPFLAALAPVAAAHHERLDRSGYHRGSPAAELTMPARLLAAADAFHAMCEPRPHREPLVAGAGGGGARRARRTRGRLDPDAVTAVVEAAGQQAPRLERPAGLTEREAEVVVLLARGLQTKQVAQELGISVKTADRHIQNAYGKIGVSTRAAATLFAMEHGLVAWGELPIEGRGGQS